MRAERTVLAALLALALCVPVSRAADSPPAPVTLPLQDLSGKPADMGTIAPLTPAESAALERQRAAQAAETLATAPPMAATDLRRVLGALPRAAWTGAPIRKSPEVVTSGASAPAEPAVTPAATAASVPSAAPAPGRARAKARERSTIVGPERAAPRVLDKQPARDARQEGSR